MSILGAIGGSMSADKLSKGYKAAGDQVAKIYNESDLHNVYAPGGAAAFTAQQNLLGLGDNPAAAQNAFDQFRDSTGYRTALEGGNDAITSAGAAGLGLKSGAIDKARLRFGTGLANSYFNDYFDRLGGQARVGYGADSAVTGAIADARWNQYVGKGKAKAMGMDNVFSGLGDAFGAGDIGKAIWGG